MGPNSNSDDLIKKISSLLDRNIASLHTEIQSSKTEVCFVFKTEVDAVKTEVQRLKTEIKAVLHEVESNIEL